MRAGPLPWLLLSLAIHVTIGQLRPHLPERTHAAATPIEVAVAVVEQHDVAPAPSLPAGNASEPARRTHRASISKPAAPRPEAPPLEATPLVTSEPSPDRPSIDLSPRSAALTAMQLDVPDAGVPLAQETAEHKLEQAIRAGATRPVDKAPEPKLLPREQGGYEYRGNGFHAIIAPDGSLSMSDQNGTLVLPLVPYRNREGKWRVSPVLGGSFRLYEWLDKKLGKNDPHASERRWFLEHTRALRERLWQQHAPRSRHESDVE